MSWLSSYGTSMYRYLKVLGVGNEYSRIPEHASTRNETQVTVPDPEVESWFAHLRFANQTYFHHMKDSLHYSWCSFKASFYFFIHAFYPDLFQHSGSDVVITLNDDILEKYTENINRLTDRYL